MRGPFTIQDMACPRLKASQERGWAKPLYNPDQRALSATLEFRSSVPLVKRTV